MSYQFIHVETYARIPSRTKKKQSAKGVAAEAERKPHACPHVPNPRQPKLMYGVMPSEAVALAEQRAAAGKDSIGRKIRKDGQIILGGIVSYPVPISDLSPSDPDFQKWLHLTQNFLLKKYGSRYLSCVAHSDESHFHLHFYCTPELDKSGRFSIAQVHQGIAARDELGGGDGKAKMRAYKSAMRDFQDEYYFAVGIKCGLTRDGPKRKRLTRKEWKAEQESARRMSDSLKAFDDAQLIIDRLEEKSASVASKEDLLDKRENQLIAAYKKIKAERDELLKARSSESSLVSYLKDKILSLSKKVTSLLDQVSTLTKANRLLSQKLSSLQKQAEKKPTLEEVHYDARH